MARGGYALAETILRQLVAQYPQERKAAEQLLAQVQSERVAQLRRARQARGNQSQQKAPVRPAATKKAAD